MYLIVPTTHKIMNSIATLHKLTQGVFDGVEPVTYLDESKTAQAAIKVPLNRIDDLGDIQNVFASVGDSSNLLVLDSGVVLECIKGQSTPSVKGFWHQVKDRKVLAGAVHYFVGSQIFRVEGGLYA